MSQPLICVDIGGSFIKLAFSDRPGQVHLLEQVANPATDWSQLVGTLKQLIHQWQTYFDVDSPLAISTTGVVDSQLDRVFAGNIPAYHNHAIKQELSKALKRTIYLANDADCFTLAETHFGHAQQLPIVLGAILGTGIGGGLVIHGQIIEGRAGICAEWGHGPITKTQVIVDGRMRQLPRILCGCGQSGCVDTLAGARGLERLHKHLHAQTLDSRAIIKAWHASESLACQTIDVWLQVLSEPLALTLNILGASRVVVGGGLASETALIAQLDSKVQKMILNPCSEALIVPGLFHQIGGLIGASILPSMGAY